jgi:hypothetical protein
MNIIPLTNQGGVIYKVNFGTSVYSLVLKYNYTAECWTMDILDSVDTLMLAGIMLVPDLDLLGPYPTIKETIGRLTIIEKNLGDYKNADLLGTNVQLVWS